MVELLGRIQLPSLEKRKAAQGNFKTMRYQNSEKGYQEKPYQAYRVKSDLQEVVFKKKLVGEKSPKSLV